MAEKTDPKIVKRVFALREEYKKAPDWHEIAEAINKEFGAHYNHKSMANVYNRFAKGVTAPDKREPHTAEPESLAFIERVAEIRRTSKKKVVNLSTGEWRKCFTEAQGVRERLSDRELQSTATINTDAPIALSFMGDFHVGSPHTDYDRLYSDVDFIKSNPRIYCCISGDRTDQFIPGFRDASAVAGQLTPPELQFDAVEAILKELGPSIVAAIGGNHDVMGKRKTGIDAERWLRRGMSFSYMPHGGLLTLTVGTQQYKILWKHSYKFQSALNKFNSHHRMMEILEPTADVVVQEHLHDAGMESIEKVSGGARRTIVSIRTGAYKRADGFSMDWYKEGTPAPQTVILYPDRKKIVAIHGEESLSDAAIYLNGIGGKRK